MSDKPNRTILLHDLDIDESRVDGLRTRLCSLAQGVGVSLNDAQARLCLEHLLYVDQVNAYINLTRITDLDDAVVLHIVDSLTLVPYIAADVYSSVDMGTGAGFPGVPLGVVSGQPGCLLDSVGKKVNAVNAIVQKLGLDRLTAVHTRLEAYGKEHRGSADLVVARALAQLPILLEYASPILKHGGQLLVSKGNPTDDEVEHGRAAAKLCGFELVDVHRIELPGGYGHREIFDFRLLHKPSVKLPRADGMAKRQPLG